jgi:hypothetical protein
MRSFNPEIIEKFFCPFAHLKFEKIRDLRTFKLVHFIDQNSPAHLLLFFPARK